MYAIRSYYEVQRLEAYFEFRDVEVEPGSKDIENDDAEDGEFRRGDPSVKMGVYQ